MHCLNRAGTILGGDSLYKLQDISFSPELTALLFSHLAKCIIMHTQGLDNCHKRPILPRVSPDPVIGGEITERTAKRRRRSQNHGAQSTVVVEALFNSVAELRSAEQNVHRAE